jgi:hypothetical protein
MNKSIKIQAYIKHEQYICFPEADLDLRGSSSNQCSNTSIHAQKGSAYKV